jgi:hypothetical protein
MEHYKLIAFAYNGRSLIVGASMGSTTMGRSIVFASMGLYHNGQIYSFCLECMGSTTMVNGQIKDIFCLNGLYYIG